MVFDVEIRGYLYEGRPLHDFGLAIEADNPLEREELRSHTVEIVATLKHDNMSDSTGCHRIELWTVVDWRAIYSITEYDPN